MPKSTSTTNAVPTTRVTTIILFLLAITEVYGMTVHLHYPSMARAILRFPSRGFFSNLRGVGDHLCRRYSVNDDQCQQQQQKGNDIVAFSMVNSIPCDAATTSSVDNVTTCTSPPSTSSYFPNRQILKDLGCCEQIFSFALPEGHCVGLRLLQTDLLRPPLNTVLNGMLHPDEMAYGSSIPPGPGQTAFFVGRLGMRMALNIFSNHPDVASSTSSTSILKDKHGRPILPTGVIGSISHKRKIGVALVDVHPQTITDTTTEDKKLTKSIGVDIEQTFTKRPNIDKRILTLNEIQTLGQIPNISRNEEVLLRFSLKESLYKAMHPLINQYVGFQEAEVTPHPNGTASFVLNLKSGAHDRFHTITAHWRRINVEGEDGGDGYFLTSASVTLKQD